MNDEISEWLEQYGERVEFAEPARFIRQLQAEKQSAHNQAVANLRIAAREMRALADRFYAAPTTGETK